MGALFASGTGQVWLSAEPDRSCSQTIAQKYVTERLRQPIQIAGASVAMKSNRVMLTENRELQALGCSSSTRREQVFFFYPRVLRDGLDRSTVELAPNDTTQSSYTVLNDGGSMSASHKWKAQYFFWTVCFLSLFHFAGLPLAAQDPTAQTAVNNVESLGTIPASQPLAGLGFNIDTTNEWEFVLAASAGTTHVRFQCSWSEIEAQTAPPSNTSGGYALSPNCAKALALSKKYGMHPTIIAAFGAPFHQILTVSVPNGAAAGDKTLNVQFSSGVGGDSLASMVAFDDGILASNGNQLSGRNSYAGDLITAVNRTDDTHATLTLASALSSGLPANATSTYTINEYLTPPAATTSANDPSVTAYSDYAHFLAQSIAAAGMTGEVEIWNEPPWSPDPWDVRQNFYDAFPGPGIPGPLASNQPNWGFAAALSRASYTVAGVSYVWAGTNKSADNSLLTPALLLNTGTSFVQPATNVQTESIHPYGNNPEDDIWSEACVKSSILPNPLKPLYFMHCNLDSNSSSNVVELEQLNLIAKVLNPKGGIAHSITETGFSLSGGDLAHEARFVMRQFLAYQAVGVTPVEFYRLYDTSPDDLTFTNVSTNAPLPAFTAISGLMADLATIKGAPVVSATASNLPSIVSYGGFFPLDTVAIVGSRAGDNANSEVFAVWQRSHVSGSAKWGSSSSPTAVPVTIAVPTGSTAVSVLNLDTRTPVAFTVSGQQITFSVSDDPVEVLVEPVVANAPTATGIAIAPGTASIVEGVALNFSCTATLSDGTTAACASPVYSSSNAGVASVSSNVVTGLTPGSATITASVVGVASSASAQVTVTAPAATVTAISIAPGTASVVEGAALNFSCTATLSNGTTSKCASPVYSSSNAGVASVSSNVVTGLTPGSATITASVVGVAASASAQVTVMAPAAMSGALTALPATGITYGAPVSLTETIPAVGGGCTTSSAVFSSGALVLGGASFVGSPQASPTSCIATITTTALPAGADQVAATSAAEGAFGAISSATTVSVAAAPGGGDTLAVGPTSTTAGSPVTMVFKLPGVAGAAAPATGSVVFISKGITLGKGVLTTTGTGTGAVTTATLVSSSLTVGADVVTGMYAGDQNYGPANPTAMETVTSKPTGNPTTAASIALSGLAHTYNGAEQGVSVATTPAGIAYEVTYNGTSGAPIGAGTYAVIATITDPAYSAQPATGELTISKGQSKLTWTPYTTVSSPDVAIGANVLNAQCSEPGEVAYTAVSQDAAPLAVTPASFLTVGQYTLTGVCTPLDSKDYASSSGSVSLSVINDTVFVSNLVGDVSMFFNNGVSQGPDTTSGGVGVAVDRSGNVWSINSSGNSVTKFDKTGAMLSVSTGGGLSSPKALAVDDSGRVWIANGGGTLSALQTDGTPASTAAYANPALSGPTSVAIDFKGSVWVANESSNTITEVIGVAAPTVTPMIAEVTQPQ
jgi:hypothetical protein